MSESQPILPSSANPVNTPRKRRVTAGFVLVSLIAACILVGILGDKKAPEERLPEGSLELAKYYLDRSPVIDSHIDLPELARVRFGNDVDSFDLNKETEGHLDIPRLREGRLGGFFWSVFVSCTDSGPDFLTPTYRVRDTLEQIDVSKQMIDKYSDTFEYCETSEDVKEAIKNGKVASLLGVEGAHQIGNSLAVLRQFYALGVRYMTLTHSCNNAFADSAGIFEAVTPVHGGLSPIGKELIYEMNRLGMLIDISHVSDSTASQAIDLTQAPVIWSHSASRHYNNISRNVPDWVVKKIGKKGKDGVIMVNIYPAFMSPTPGTSSVLDVADHVEWISGLIGRQYVGIGSDFDGIETTPIDMEDVSKYPNLFAELINRGWSRQELAGLAGENVLRILKGAEDVSAKMKKDGKKISQAVYAKRKDLKQARKRV